MSKRQERDSKQCVADIPVRDIVGAKALEVPTVQTIRSGAGKSFLCLRFHFLRYTHFAKKLVSLGSQEYARESEGAKSQGAFLGESNFRKYAPSHCCSRQFGLCRPC